MPRVEPAEDHKIGKALDLNMVFAQESDVRNKNEDRVMR
jgi:hypothetical protein